MMLSTQIRVTLLVPSNPASFTRNPSCASMGSTMVMAPMRKNRMLAISPRCSSRWPVIAAWPATPGRKKLVLTDHLDHPNEYARDQR